MLQLIPGNIKLTLGALVIKAVETGVFDQNIQAVHEGTGRGYPAGLSGCGCRLDTLLLMFSGGKRKRNAKPLIDAHYGGNWTIANLDGLGGAGVGACFSLAKLLSHSRFWGGFGRSVV